MASQAELVRLGIAGRLDSGGCFARAASRTIPPEGHLRMNKKIATLTQVIMELNERCEDHGYDLDCLKYEHAKETESLKKQVAKEKEGASKHRQEANSQIGQLQESNGRSIQQRRAAENKSAEAECRLLEANATATELRTSLAESKAECQELLAARIRGGNALQREIDANERRLAEQRASTDVELTASRAYGERSHELAVAAEQRAKRADETAATERRRADEAAATARAERDDAVGRLQRAVDDLSAERDTLLRRRDSLVDELEQTRASASDSSEGLLGKAAELTDRLNATVGERDSCRVELEALREDFCSQVEHLRALQTDLAAAGDKAAKQLRENEEVKAQNTVLQVSCRGMEEDAKRRAADHGSLQAECVQLRSMVRTQNDEMARTNTHCLELERTKAMLELAQDEAAKHLALRVRDLETEVSELLSYQAKLKGQYAREIEAQQARSCDAEEQLREEGERRVAAARKACQEEVSRRLASCDSQHNAVVEEMNRRHDDKMSTVRDETRAEVASARAETSALSDELSAARCELESKVKRLAEQQAETGDVSSKVESLTTLLERSRAAVEKAESARKRAELSAAKLQEQLKSLENASAAQVKSLEQEHCQALGKQKRTLDEGWTERLQRECERLRLELGSHQAAAQEGAIAKLTELSAAQREELRREAAAVEASLKAEIGTMTQERDATRASLADCTLRCEKQEAELNAMNKRLKEAERVTTSELAAASTRYEKLNCELNAEIDKLKAELVNRSKQHEADIQEMRAEGVILSKVHDDSRQTAVTTALEEAAAVYQAHVDNVRREMEAEKVAALGAREQQLEEQHGAVERQMRFDTEQLSSKLKVAEGNLAHAALDERTMREQTETLTVALEDSKLVSEALRRDVDVYRDSVAVCHRESAERQEKLRTTLHEQHRNELLAATNDCKRRLEMVSARVKDSEDVWNARTRALEEALVEARVLHESRLPRQEDLDAIRQLEGELITQRETIKKLQDLLKTYGIELKHRDDTITKVFMGGSRAPATMNLAEDPLWFMSKKYTRRQPVAAQQPPQRLPPLTRQGSAPQVTALATRNATQASPTAATPGTSPTVLKSRSFGALTAAASSTELQQRRLQRMKDAGELVPDGTLSLLDPPAANEGGGSLMFPARHDLTAATQQQQQRGADTLLALAPPQAPRRVAAKKAGKSLVSLLALPAPATAADVLDGAVDGENA